MARDCYKFLFITCFFNAYLGGRALEDSQDVLPPVAIRLEYLLY